MSTKAKVLERRSSILEERDKIDDFLQCLPRPDNLEAIRNEVVQFCEKFKHKRIVLVTVSLL